MAKADRKKHDKPEPKVETVNTKSQTTTTTGHSAPKALVLWVLFFALSLVFYGGTLQNGYSLDDELVTLDQPNVENGLSGIPDILTSRYSVNAKQSYEYRPIALVTYAIEYQFFGRNAAVSHFFNILLYSILCLVIYKLVLRLFEKQSWWFAFFTALLFIIHPIHSEVVVSLKNRDEILALLFSLISFLFLLTYAERGKIKHLITAALVFLLAMLSKKSAVMFFVLIPFILVYVKKVQLKKGFVIGGVLFFSGIVVLRLLVVALFDTETFSRETFFYENPLNLGHHSLLVKLNYAFGTFGFYICKFVMPYPLIGFYGYNVFDGFGFSLYHAVGYAAVACILYSVYRYWKKDPVIVVSLVFFAVSIAIFLNFLSTAPGIVAERFLFTGSMGLCMLIAWLLFTTFGLRLKTISFATIPGKLKLIIVVLAIVYAVIVIPRNKDWYSSYSLYKADIVSAPNSAKLHSLLGTTYTAKLNNHTQGGEKLTQLEIKLYTDSAIAVFRNGLKVYNNYPSINNNLGTLYFNYRLNNDSAGYFFKRAIECDSDFVEAYFNMANYYENISGLENEKYQWLTYINKILKNDSLVTVNANTLTEKLRKTDNIFFRMFFIKSLITQTFKNVISGKDKTAPKQIVYGLVEGYKGLLPEFENYAFNSDKAIESILQTMKFASAKERQDKAEYYLDSVVNAVYTPYIEKYVRTDLKINLETLNVAVVQQAKQKTTESRQTCYKTCMKALAIKPDYFQLYTRFNPILMKWGMYSESVELNKQMLKSNKYKEYSVEFALAEAQLLKGELKEGMRNLIQAYKDLQLMMNRLKLAKQNFSQAGSNFVVTNLMNVEQLNLNNASYFVNKLEPVFHDPTIAFEVAQVKQLYNMLFK